jgi:hypothetical protein
MGLRLHFPYRSVALAFAFLASTASAEVAPSAPPQPPPVETATVPPPPPVIPPAPSSLPARTSEALPPPVPALATVQLAVPWGGPTGRGVSFGIEEGGWSGIFGPGLRVHVPFFSSIGGSRGNGGSFGATLRGVFLSGANASPTAVPAEHAGGRLELIGRSPVFLNLVRLYGGGGVDLLAGIGSSEGFDTQIRTSFAGPPLPVASHKAIFSGGGEFGFEFFLQRSFSFFLEVGGWGGVDNGLPAGETVVAGMNVYPFS